LGWMGRILPETLRSEIPDDRRRLDKVPMSRPSGAASPAGAKKRPNGDFRSESISKSYGVIWLPVFVKNAWRIPLPPAGAPRPCTPSLGAGAHSVETRKVFPDLRGPSYR